MLETQHDLVIIGSGPGGYVAAIRAGQLGLDTCVVEQDPFLGGTCLHRGCIPTKALLHTADLLQQARDGARFGVVCGEVKLDLKAAQAHKTRVVTKSSKGVEFLLRKNKVAWVQGTGKLAGNHAVEITRPDGSVEKRLAKNIILATGSSTRTTFSNWRKFLRGSWCSGVGRWEWSSPRSSRVSAPRSPSWSCWTACCRSRTRTSPPR